MDKKIVGVIGAISGLAAFDTAAQATTPATLTTDLMNVRSFAELLDPIPNAVAALRAADAATAQEEAVGGQTGNVQVAGYHHHHARWRSRWAHHHHHHHHHNRWQSRWRHHHHHHHHHLSY